LPARFSMVIGGLQKFTLSDFPGMISAIVFTRGCCFRCPYCHNPELVDPSQYIPTIPLQDVRDFLSARRGRLQGVVFTGGEPTIHADLPAFLAELKDMGFAVKLDTNGTNPRMLQRLVADRIVDFVAMDIKAPLALYPAMVRAPVATSDLLLSIGLILRSGLQHEFRTTFIESILSVEDMLGIAELVKGCERYVLQSVREWKVLEPDLQTNASANRARLVEIAGVLKAAGHPVEIR
jgi:pyruvate formate lyase activating enzyme